MVDMFKEGDWLPTLPHLSDVIQRSSMFGIQVFALSA
jgi:hypothetical protein